MGYIFTFIYHSWFIFFLLLSSFILLLFLSHGHVPPAVTFLSYVRCVHLVFFLLSYRYTLVNFRRLFGVRVCHVPPVSQFVRLSVCPSVRVPDSRVYYIFILFCGLTFPFFFSFFRFRFVLWSVYSFLRFPSPLCLKKYTLHTNTYFFFLSFFYSTLKSSSFFLPFSCFSF